MPNGIRTRLLTVIIVFVLSVLFVIPTANYFYVASKNPPPRREEFKSDEDFTSATLKYNQMMTNLRAGMPLLGRPLPLGLDLQGGVDVLLSVSREKILEDNLRVEANKILARIKQDEIDATVDLNKQKDGIEIRLKNPANQSDVERILENYTVFQAYNRDDLKDTVNGLTLRLKPDQVDFFTRSSIDSAMDTVRRRVDELGVTMPTVVKVGNEYIRVQVPGERDPQHVIDLVIRPANLEFRMVHPTQEDVLQQLKFDPYGAVIGGQVPTHYVVMFGKPLASRADQRYPNERTFKVKMENRVEKEREEKVLVYIVKDQAALVGGDLADARYSFNPSNIGQSPHEVSIEFKKEGTRTFADLTKNFLHDRMAIILEGKVMSAPELIAHITDGRARITGDFEAAEARELSMILRAGALPTHLKPEQKVAVGATLGADAVRKGVNSLMYGALIVTLFMIAYYFDAGVIAVIAVCVNVLIVIAVMALSRATLTLSGIGGILLTIGMAVDCNVLIAERQREENVVGGTIKAIIMRSFNRAFATILDANLTTLITSLALLQFGAPTMQGFALTMSFGIVATLFTGVFVTRVLTDIWAQHRGHISCGVIRLIHDTKFDFIRWRFAAYAFSGALILLSAGGYIHKGGLNLGPDFLGGVTATVEFSTKDVKAENVRAVFPDAQIQSILDVGVNRFIVTHKLVDKEVEPTDKLIRNKLAEAFPGQYTVLGVNGVGPAVGGEFRTKALLCILMACIGIFVFIWFRYERDFGMTSVVALLHDIIITQGFLLWMNIPISLDVVAALLTILGYSINDTVVNFDRIRENFRTPLGRRLGDLISVSLNQCLSRTIITSLTVVLALCCMLIFGGKGLYDFAITMLFGVFIGTYSSDFIAAPLIYDWRKWRGTAGIASVAPKTEGPAGPSGEEEEAEEGGPGAIKPIEPKHKEGPRTRGVRVDPIVR